MPNAMDKLKLIAEVRKRPEIWDVKCKEHKSLRFLQKAWNELALTMGSEVDDCKNMWKNLRQAYRVIVKKSELYIAEDKLNGSYDPSNDYSSKWVYYEHLTFLDDINKQSPMNLPNDNNSDDDDSNQFSKSHNMDNIKVEPELDLERNNSLAERDMSNAMDKLKLIAEIRKRRELWDIRSEEHRSCLSLTEVWKDLAVSMESDVDACQRNWLTLCKVYRRSVKRMQSRIKEANLNGSYDPNNDYSSKWAYFEAMQFMKYNQTGPIILRSSSETLKLIAEIRKRPAIWDIQSKEHRHTITLQKTWKELALAMGTDGVNDCKRKWTALQVSYRHFLKKLELRIQEAKLNGSYNPNNDYISEWIYFEHMKFIDNINKPSPIKLRNSPVNDNNSNPNQVSKFHNMENIKMEPELDIEPEMYLPDDDDNSPQTPVNVKLNLAENQEPADDKPTTSNWKCTKRSYDQANFVEDIEKDEHKLIKSPRSDITDSNNMVHVTDSDYNFLVSFLPQMKKINELQNLQFRTKITNLMLNIMSQSKANDTGAVSSSKKENSKNYS